MKKSFKNWSLVTKNKKAYFDYEILETWERGIELYGFEVKSIRLGQVNLKWAYISMISWYPMIKSMHIWVLKSLPNSDSIDTKPDRKIFLHRKTIDYLIWKSNEWWYAIIPLSIYFKWSLIKVQVWLARWKKKFDKRQVLKNRDMEKRAKVAMSKYI